MKKMHTQGGGVNKTPKTKSLKSFIALGLSTLLPSFALSAESNDILNQLLTSTPQDSNESKIKEVQDYSPFVDLRSSAKVAQYNEIWSNGWKDRIDNPFVWDKDTTILITNPYFFRNGGLTTYEVANNATVTMDVRVNSFTDMNLDHGILATNSRSFKFTGNGSFVINAHVAQTNKDSTYAFLTTVDNENGMDKIVIDSDTFIFKASGNLGAFFSIVAGPVTQGKHYLNSNKLIIDMDNNGANISNKKYVYIGKSYYGSTPKVGFNVNPNDFTQANNQSMVMQLTGNLGINITDFYAHFTNSQSFLKGNIELLDSAGRGSTLITFSNGSRMEGDIDVGNNLKNQIIFDNANFSGSIKNSQSNNKGENTTITFASTSGKTFGNGTDDIVETGYKGKVIGSFDVSSNSNTVIHGNNGNKGFAGTGTNILAFDFKNSARKTTANQNKFKISGGNATSHYALIGMTERGKGSLNLTQLSASDNIFSRISNAGIIVDPALSGILFFQKTAMDVGTDENALFAKKENITGTSGSLTTLAMGAMFGNAIWNDTNGDASVSTNEIVANSGGKNYRLVGKTTSGQDGVDGDTSTGDIGKASDGVSKYVGFVFTEGTYVFNGDYQGYSGTIRGGTDTSKYFFANAGYINASQVDEAGGDIILFKTAFRGDLGVGNKKVAITLDFSNNQKGLTTEAKAGSPLVDANIVGAGEKNITFNFTDNTKKEKFTGAIIGNVSKQDSTGNSDSDTAKYTMLNLKKYDKDGQIATNNGMISGTDLVDAIQKAGVTNFNKTGSLGSAYPGNTKTDISSFSADTILGLCGTSLDISNMNLNNYIYDFAFGDGIGTIDGVEVQSSKLKGTINLSGNSRSGHSFVFKGNAIEGNASGILNADNKLVGFSYDDSSANYSIPVSFTLSGISQAKYVSNSTSALVKGDALAFTQTNLTGNLWADQSVKINLDFRDGRTWKYDGTSGLELGTGSNLVVHGSMKNASTPELKIKTSGGLKSFELINTEANLALKLVSNWDQSAAQTFALRGTSLTMLGSNIDGKRLSGGVQDGGYNLVFAKGTNLESNVAKQNSGYYKITEEGSNNGRSGKFKNGKYDGNYVAESSTNFSGINISSAFKISLIGEGAWTTAENDISGNNFFDRGLSFSLSNASNSTAFDAGRLGKFFKRDNTRGEATITIEGTSIEDGNNLIQRSAQQNKLTFNMAFVKEGSGTYVSEITGKFQDLALSNADGSLADSVLKVAQSSLNSGLDFKGSNFNVTFAGNASQSLSGTNVFKGGSASSILTLRGVTLNAGSDTAHSSIQDIKGKIIFDLSHANEDSIMTGTLSNMLASGGKYQTKFGATRGDGVQDFTLDKLVFVNVAQANTSDALGKLASNGHYFNDMDTFGALTQADYSNLSGIKNVRDNESSNLSFGDGTIALTGNQEIFFIGADSHDFDGTTSKLGNSTGSTLTFIDSGGLVAANLVNSGNGKGTINLIGKTKIAASGNKITLKDSNHTGTGITINAVITANNAWATDNNQAIKNAQNQNTSLKGASTFDIGQVGEQTVYHLLFDYTSSALTYGEHQAYQGTIAGLDANSIIKFKNAGYITTDQIDGTDATVLVDNTQIKGDFRGDNAILDFRNNRPSVTGNIITSDKSTNKLSQKVLTFDLTGSSSPKLFNGAIQAGYKVAPGYTADAQSVLTFQNGSSMTLGNDDSTRTASTSTFIKSLAKDVGFSGIGNAEITENGFVSTNKTTSYILKGTKLAFQGMNISATNKDKAIVENDYFLDLTFDNRANGKRGRTGLDSELNASSLTANSITMGEYDGSHPLGLALTFHNAGSLHADNSTLNVKLKENAHFNLTATSSNGHIGTIVLSQNNGTFANLGTVAKDSSLSIGAGSVSFVGDFKQNSSGATAGDIDVAFNGVNKVYGTLTGQGNVTVSLSGNALFTEDEANKLGFTKGSDQFADLVIDAKSGSLVLNLKHTSGMVGIVGQDANNGSPSSYTNVDLSGVVGGDVALKGAFALTGNATFGGNNTSRLKIEGNALALKLNDGKSLSISENGLIDSQSAVINIKLGGNNETNHLILNNLGDKVSNIKLSVANTSGNTKGDWKIRGTNVELNQIVVDNDDSNFSKTLIFAKGNGVDTTHGTTLHELTNDDKIAVSSLSFGANGTVLDNGKVILIGKEALTTSGANQKLDGDNDNQKLTIGLYNSILRNGDELLKNTRSGTSPINDNAILRGTDTINLAVNGADNNSTINAVYINDGSTTTGNDYVDSSSAYAVGNASGVLSSNILKTLKSKAYGNITLADTVTADMKFIGENSHSFDGKTKVDNGTISYSADGTNNWKNITESNGVLSANGHTTTSGSLATLTGGNSKSRFDFDHTSVSLDQIKGAGGNTYVYNSTIKGNIKVDSNTNSGTTTLFFNASGNLTESSQKYVQSSYGSKGIDIDFSTAHKMTADNLGGANGSKTLETTTKTTNLVFMGIDSVDTGNTTKLNNSGNSIDISFLKNISGSTMGATGYNYTFIDGGVIKAEDLELKVVGGDGAATNKPTTDNGYVETVFANAKVNLINTYVTGARNFAQVGFIDTYISGNRFSKWGGGTGVQQYLIFDFYNGNNNSLLNGGGTFIDNTDASSRFIFSGIFADSTNHTSEGRTIVLVQNGLKQKINEALGVSNAIDGNVTGYLGLRGVSIQGDIDESTNGVDIVFNSTNNISYVDSFNTENKHEGNIVENGVNLVSVASTDKNRISGYAILKPTSTDAIVTIKGGSNKDITFIGENAVEGGFDRLAIQGGSEASNYTFYKVGNLSQTFLDNVGLHNASGSKNAVAGNFRFENSAITGDINANHANANNFLTFENVDYTGTISGSMKKNLKFGVNSGHIAISGGSDDSVYDFTNFSGKSIELDIDLSNNGNYLTSEIKGFEGNTSLVGSLKLARSTKETSKSDYTNTFAFNNDAKWTMTDDSRVMNLYFNNSGLEFNLDLASAPRTQSKADSRVLRELSVASLNSNGGQVLLGTQIDSTNQANSKSDLIKAGGINGTLYITAQDEQLNQGSFSTDGDDAIVLVTANSLASGAKVVGAERKIGISYVNTTLEHQVSSDNVDWTVADENASSSDFHRWVLSSFQSQANEQLVDEGSFMLSNPYRMLMIESNNLNKRMGDLRDDNYNQGAWIRVFNGMDSGEGAKNLYTNIQLGYDYGTPAIGAKNYSGVAFSTSIVDIDGDVFNGKANTYSLAAYNAYIADSGLYVDTIAKYLYTDQKFDTGSGMDDNFGSHALSLGVEVGYRAYMGESNFYIEPQAEVIGGLIIGVKDINLGTYYGDTVKGELETTTAINARIGVVQGYSLKTENGFRADFRLGTSLVNEYVSDANPIKLTDSVQTVGKSIGSDQKIVVNVGTNLILTDQWRVYIDAEKSFGGNRNTDYQANIGARFSFGDKLVSLPKPQKPLPLKVEEQNTQKSEQIKSSKGK